MKRFEMKKNGNGQFYFNLFSQNNEIILRSSEVYNTKQGCENGINSVKRHAPFDHNYERRRTSNFQYDFILKAANGEVIGVSETYTTEASRENGIAAVKRDAPTAPIRDLT